MQRLAETTLPLAAGVAATDARQVRALAARAGTWLSEVWAGADETPVFTWAMLSALPAWALETPAQLDRLTLLAGALFAAPSLRVCLDPAPLLHVRELIGAPALEQVLAVPGLPPVAPPWPAGEGRERGTLLAWGGALLLASLDDRTLRASVARLLDVTEPTAPLLPASAANRLVLLALHILDSTQARQTFGEAGVA